MPAPSGCSLRRKSPPTWLLAEQLANDMSQAAPYTITFTPAARRRLSNLPLTAATALYEHLTGPVAGNPRQIGQAVRRALRGGPVQPPGRLPRPVYRRPPARVVTALAVAHRRDAYRPQ